MTGIPKDKPVTALVDEDMAEIARHVRAKAKARGMTDEGTDERSVNAAGCRYQSLG